MRHTLLDTDRALAILPQASPVRRKESSMLRQLPRIFSGFAVWIILGLALAVIPVACGSSSTGQDSGPADMTKSG